MPPATEPLRQFYLLIYLKKYFFDYFTKRLKLLGLEKKLFPYESNRLVDLEIGDLLKFFILKFRENSKKLQRVNEKHHSVSKVNWFLSHSL